MLKITWLMVPILLIATALNIGAADPQPVQTPAKQDGTWLFDAAKCHLALQEFALVADQPLQC